MLDLTCLWRMTSARLMGQSSVVLLVDDRRYNPYRENSVPTQSAFGSFKEWAGRGARVGPSGVSCVCG